MTMTMTMYHQIYLATGVKRSQCPCLRWSASPYSRQRLVDYIDTLSQSLAQFDVAPLQVAGFACTWSSYLIGPDDEAARLNALSAARGSPVRACCKRWHRNGFAGKAEMVDELLPTLRDGTFAGHNGNDGSAIAWGRAPGTRLADLGGYQGHGSWAVPCRAGPTRWYGLECV